MIDLDNILPAANRRYMVWFLMVAFALVSVLLVFLGSEATHNQLILAWGAVLGLALPFYFTRKTKEHEANVAALNRPAD